MVSYDEAKLTKGIKKHAEGSTEICIRIAGLKVQSANHYTIEPCVC